MPITKVQEYSATAGSNSDVDGTNIAENCSPAGINDAIRGIMAHIKTALSGSDDSIMTGTAGTSGNVAMFNADGDLVDGGSAPQSIADGSVTTAKIADANVTTAKIADDAVTADKLADTAVTAGSYTAADITVDAQGRITSAASGASGASTLTDVGGSRALSTTYTNSSGNTMTVMVTCLSGASGATRQAEIYGLVDGNVVIRSSYIDRSSGNGYASMTWTVPDGSTYRVNDGGIATPIIDEWWELS